MKYIISAFILLLALSIDTYAEHIAHFEDDLLTVDAGVASAIRKTSEAKDYAECDIVSKTIDHLNSSAKTYYYATTKDACGKGNHAGPHWIVCNENNQYRILLFDIGTAISDTKNLDSSHLLFIVENEDSGELIQSKWAPDINGNYTKK